MGLRKEHIYGTTKGAHLWDYERSTVMGLHFNTGPSWENDMLNQINITSVEDNAVDMYINKQSYKPDYFPNTTSANTGGSDE